jgi:hypothetical protein
MSVGSALLTFDPKRLDRGRATRAAVELMFDGLKAR